MKALSDVVAFGFAGNVSAFASGGGGGSGDVVGPASATDNNAVRFDGTTGKLVQTSQVTIEDDGQVITPAGFTALYATFGGHPSGGRFVMLSPNAATQMQALVQNGNSQISYVGGDLDFYSGTAGTVARFTPDGELLVGTTSVGSSLLKVAGSIESTVTGFVFPDATTQATAGVLGPASATDNAIVRYDAATGKLIQNSAATIGDDGEIRSATNSGANAVSVPLCNWVMQTADRTLTSSTAEQKVFGATANGALTLPAGIYEFDAFLYLTTMSATSGNLAFDPVGAGTAVTDRWGQYVSGIDNSNPLNAGTQTGSASVTQQTPASAVSAGTGTGMIGRYSGMFRISTGGTIIPSVTLVTANAAVVKAGSWLRIKKIGESGEGFVGAWT
jgi:hypothetical protein